PCRTPRPLRVSWLPPRQWWRRSRSQRPRRQCLLVAVWAIWITSHFSKLCGRPPQNEAGFFFLEHAMPSTLIPGANRGLGLAFASQYLANGWQVYAGCRDPDSASELRRLADPSNRKLRIMALDVTDSISVKAAATLLEGQAIDLLLNNAGVMG